jgi:hypothetical protein
MSPITIDWPRTPPTISVYAPQPTSGYARSAQLEPVVYSDSAPWLVSALSRLRTLETTGIDIPGIGDLRIAEPTANRVRRLLAAVPGRYLPEPKLAAFSGGGLAVIWTVGERELAFTAYPGHDDFVFMHTIENEEAVEEGMLTLDQAPTLSNLINSFLIPPTQ